MREEDILVIQSAKLLKKRYDKLKQLLAAPEIAIDSVLFRRYSREYERLSVAVGIYNELTEAINAHARYLEELRVATDTELKEIITKEISTQDARIEELTIKLESELLKREEVASKVILELRAGEGGTLSAQLCSDLVDIYENYAKRKGYSVTSESYYHNEGTKYAVINIEGEGAYSHFKYENGEHRIISKGRTGRVSVIVYKEEYEEIKVEEKDIKIELFHASGAGGQHVNKVESAVRAIHTPTGITTVCQDERSQLQNKQRAVANLKTKVYEYYLRKREEETLATKKAKQTTDRVRNYDYNKGKVFDKKSGGIEDLKFAKQGHLDNFINALILKEKASMLK